MGEKRKDAGVALDASASWEALCVRAASWVGQGPEAARHPSDDEARTFRDAAIEGRVHARSIAAIALFARLMALATRAS